ncbi:gag/pol protein [Cucumis melo var. makuwa]|uniref:Gag/pol protein n=1 Tax=Cucumis melo var. makuwa TaxID=1194695 RepID=A0A5A7SVY9_CUCMM|nr:gag/pol protein [Cucumis melo var. makuwa]
MNDRSRELSDKKRTPKAEKEGVEAKEASREANTFVCPVSLSSEERILSLGLSKGRIPVDEVVETGVEVHMVEVEMVAVGMVVFEMVAELLNQTSQCITSFPYRRVLLSDCRILFLELYKLNLELLIMHLELLQFYLKLIHLCLIACTCVVNFKFQAMNDVEKNQWIQVIDLEMKSMYFNSVWELLDLPEGVKPIGCKWIYKRKRDSAGKVQTFKARLVGKGYIQREGVDYEETFSPVAMLKSIRILLYIATFYDYERWQMNVKTAFLNDNLEESIFMSQFEGFITQGQEQKVYKLNLFIYGLKQASILETLAAEDPPPTVESELRIAKPCSPATGRVFHPSPPTFESYCHRSRTVCSRQPSREASSRRVAEQQRPRAGSCSSSRADPPALEPSVCSGSFPPTLERLGPSDLRVLDFFSRSSSVATSTDLRRLGKRVVTVRTRPADLQVLPRDTEDQIFVPTGAHVARVRERARDWVEAEVGAKASWRATRSDRGKP